MDRETIFALVLVAGIFIPAAYRVWRGLMGLSRDQGAACGGCGSASICGCLSSEVAATDPAGALDSDTILETVLYVSNLTQDNAPRLRTTLWALDEVESVIVRPETRTMRVSYRAARLLPGDMVSALKQTAPDHPGEKAPDAPPGAANGR